MVFGFDPSIRHIFTLLSSKSFVYIEKYFHVSINISKYLRNLARIFVRAFNSPLGVQMVRWHDHVTDLLLSSPLSAASHRGGDYARICRWCESKNKKFCSVSIGPVLGAAIRSRFLPFTFLFLLLSLQSNRFVSVDMSFGRRVCSTN